MIFLYKYLEPEAYKELNDKFNHLRVQKETFVKDIMEDVKEHLDEAQDQGNNRRTCEASVQYLPKNGKSE